MERLAVSSVPDINRAQCSISASFLGPIGKVDTLVCRAFDYDPYSKGTQLLVTEDPYAVIEAILLGCVLSSCRTSVLCVSSDLAKEQLLYAWSEIGKTFPRIRSCFNIKVIKVPTLYFYKDVRVLVDFLFHISPLCTGDPSITLTPEQLPAVATDIESLMSALSLIQKGEVVNYPYVTVWNNSDFLCLFEYRAGIRITDLWKIITSSGDVGEDYLVQNGGLFSPLRKMREVCSESVNGNAVMFIRSDFIYRHILNVVEVFHKQCCGKCVAGREGGFQILQIMQKVISEKKAENNLWDLARQISLALIFLGSCEFGHSFGNWFVQVERFIHHG
ncbi:MAG: NADH-ubiquinone oxidoreductase-F iron-sulfur binding region domain-containing protein [Candidatus Bathyarchaeia archaeon]